MIHLHVSDGHVLREVPFEGFGGLPSSGWAWVDVVTDDPTHIAELGAAFGFDPLSLEDVSTDMFPKIDRFDDYRYIVFHGMTFEEDRIGTIEYDVFIRDDLLVTVRPGPVHGIDWMLEHLRSEHQLRLRTPGELVARIVEAGSRRFAPLIEALEDRIEDLEVRAMNAEASVIGESQALRRDVIVLGRVFRPQRDVLFALSREETLSEISRRAFADVYDHHFRFIESLDAARALLGSVQETHRGAIAERTNEVMKVLTVFSATMLPLTLITGIWGMNLVSLPGQEDPSAFLLVVGAMAAIVVGLWVYFAWRGFVGGPRLGKVPKAVGITLAHLGTAPLRAVVGPVAATVRRAGRTASDQGNTEPD